MNVEACVNMAFSANVQIDDPAEQGTSDNVAPGNPSDNMKHCMWDCLTFSDNCCFQVVNYPWFSAVHLVLVPPQEESHWGEVWGTWRKFYYPPSANPSVGQMFVKECPDSAMVVGRCPVLLQIKPHIIDHDFIG
jgi:hypothetical protein